MTSTCDALVVGAGGFIGGHLVRSLLLQGLEVRAVDSRPVEAWVLAHRRADNRRTDVSTLEAALAATSGATVVYHLATTPGAGPRAARMTEVLLDTHLLLAARDTGVDRVVVASTAIPEPTAHAPGPGDDPAWRLRFTERTARRFDDAGLATRIARLGPVYGPRARTDASVVTAVARRVAFAVAARQRTVEVPYAADAPAPGIYVDDAVLGLQMVAHGVDDSRPYDVVDPRPVTVAEVVAHVLAAAGTDLEVRYTAAAPDTGPAGDAAPLREAVGWAPDIPLSSVARDIYEWSTHDVRARVDLPTDLSTWVGRNPKRSRSPFTGGGVGRHRYGNAG